MRLVLALFLSLLACSGTPPGSPDSGAADAAVDAGDVDAGLDAGAGDAGVPDAGECLGSPGDRTRSVYIGGVWRSWREHVPPGYDCRRPMAVVFNFHGFSSDSTRQLELSGLNAKADDAGFIALTPEGIGVVQSWNAGVCCGVAAATGSDDVGFVREALANVRQRYAVDPKRVFATGMSNGGFFSHRLACEAADVFAAIAPVSGTMGIPTCAPSRPVPVLHFHGTADTIVPYLGGGFAGGTPVESTMRDWAARDGCGTSTRVVFQRGDATCKRWDCDGGVDVELCTIDGGGHTWPGGPPNLGLGNTSSDVSATDRAWDFFVAHPRP